MPIDISSDQADDRASLSQMPAGAGQTLPPSLAYLGRRLAGWSRRFLTRLAHEDWTEHQATAGVCGLPSTTGEVTLLVPLGPVPLSALYIARNILFETFVHSVQVVEPMPLPDGAYNGRRRQYSAYRLIKTLEACARPDTFRVIGLIEADIYIPHANFIFGTGMQGSPAIVIGLKRLAGGGANPAGRNDNAARRLAALVISQVSAGLGLGPCRTPGCARGFTNSLADLDRKTPRLCPACAARIAPWLKSSTFDK